MESVERWLRSSSYANTTIETYRLLMRLFLNWAGEQGIDIEQLADMEALRWLDGRKWGEEARYQACNMLRAYVQWRWGINHPLLSWRLRKPRPKPQSVLSLPECQLVIDAIDLDTAAGIRNRAVIMLMLDTGLRRNEVIHLELRHLDVDGCRLDALIKGGAWGAGVFSGETASALLDWLTIRPAFTLPKSEAVFVAVQGKCLGQAMTPHGFSMIFRHISERVGFHFTAHTLRRTFASLTQLNGAPTELVRRAGRWENLEQLKTYSVGIRPEDIMRYLPTNFITTD